jgi:hypothetical protein
MVVIHKFSPHKVLTKKKPLPGYTGRGGKFKLIFAYQQV